MTPEQRLAAIVSALESVGLSCLIMGGHAVRFYGLHRYTDDFDFTLAPDGWPDLKDRLARTGLFPGSQPAEGNSWRPSAFRRFLLGNLASGREEWLEFWGNNHLLAPFDELFGRRECADLGGKQLSFLSLPDLIRSKETERGKDWDDITYLEEFLDARLNACCNAGETSTAESLAQLRSRRGFDAYLAQNRFTEAETIRVALQRTNNPITQAFLVPFAPAAVAAAPVIAIEPLVNQKLRSVEPGSSLHLTLVEVVRRQYKVFCQDRDRADKQAIRASTTMQS